MRNVFFVDIDECLGEPSCETNEECENLKGSYKCVCKRGYSKNAQGVCADINECEAGNRCHENANCKDLIGYYTCECEDGFIGNGLYCEKRGEYISTTRYRY